MTCSYPVGLGLAVLRGGDVTMAGAELIDAGPIGGQVTEGVGLKATERESSNTNKEIRQSKVTAIVK